VYALRFRAYGKRQYVTLGTAEEGWGQRSAEVELSNVLADVRRGIWRPPQGKAEHAEPEPEQTFHEFSSAWFERHRPEWRDGTAGDYQWALSYHLLPWFKDHLLAQITVEEVDRYKAAKLREGKLGPATINKTLVRLAQILDEAVEYGHLDRNVARGRKRRVKAPRPQRSWVEPEQLMSLIEACDPWHRPLIATLAGAGLRIGEACALTWGDVNIATGTLTVRRSKTDAGAGRRVDLPMGLVQELAEWKARSPAKRPDDPAFITRARNGQHGPQTKDNTGRRLKGAIKRANEALAKLDIEPIAANVSPHSLRRTFASLRAALRDDPVYIAEQGGWEDPRFALSVYAKAAKRRERLSGNYLAEFDRALDWARMGTSVDSGPVEADVLLATAARERA
jgi:integrase